MKKTFIPYKLVWQLFIPVCFMGALVGCAWLIWGPRDITARIITIGCGIVFIIIPIAVYKIVHEFSVEIDSDSIDCSIYDRKTNNGGWTEEIINIRYIKITNREECQKYYKNCKAKKVLLIDFGNGNVKYIPLTSFTKRQARNMLQTITERLHTLKNA